MSSSNVTTLVLLLGVSFLLSANMTYALTSADKTKMNAALTKGIQEAAQQFGGCNDNPFPYLEARHRGDKSNSFVTPQGVSGNSAKLGLDTALACRLKKFMEFAESRGCRLTINSAMRPVQKCNPGGGKCAAQGRSCHQYGKAVDIGGSQQCLNWVLQVLGRKNSRSPFGIHSAYNEDPGYRHVQCVEHLVANCSPSTPPCNGGLQISPDLSSIPNPSSASPTSGLSDAVRNAMNPQQPQQSPQSPLQRPIQQPPIQQQQPPLDGTNQTPYPPGTCPSQKYCASSSIYQRDATCIDRQLERCEHGCEGNLTCNVSRDQTSSIFDSLTTSTATSTSSSIQSSPTPSPSSKQSAIDQIAAIADPNPPAAADAGEPLVLTISGSDTHTLAEEGAGKQTTTVSGTNDTETIPATSQQTFTSGDLSLSPDDSMYYAAPQTGMQATLAQMKEALTYALAYLRPFGRPYQTHEHGFE